ncbi:MAG: NAD-dependent epimerase/dehydratase family protein [Planctomycetes bacterium]|nr:NAD-dependent epimerase/dehydratase family protein [Planctomycetota bacterium]MCB9871046.1 NAD-dependent epimerase/dehydratase family protein [Planctomycetota bacterium]
MQALITGAGGFLGTAIAAQLHHRGVAVRGFSRRRHPHLDALGVDQVLGDLADADAVQRAVTGCDVVFHVAAMPGAWGTFQQHFDTHIAGTDHVVCGCVGAEVPHLVFTSTPSVVSRGRDLEGADESTPYARVFKAFYPATKARAEQMVRSADVPGQLRTVSLRPHLVWGPGDRHLLPRIVRRADAGSLRRIGRADKRVDTTYIDDAARAHLLAWDRLRSEPDAVGGRAYFISSGQPIPTWEMVDRLLAATGRPPVRRHVPRWVAYAAAAVIEPCARLFGRREEPLLTRWVVDELSTAHWFDLGAARRDLGYTPQVTLDEGLRRLAAWWQCEGRQLA